MSILGPWLPWHFVVGTGLLVGGLVATRLVAAADFQALRGLGRGAIEVGWRMMLAATAIYVLVRVREGVFRSMMSNLPGTWRERRGNRAGPRPRDRAFAMNG